MRGGQGLRIAWHAERPGGSTIEGAQMTTMRIFGSRKQIVAALAVHGDVVDASGRATGKLVDLAQLDPARSYAPTLAAMEADGVITREILGKRTKRIALVEPAPHPRYQEIINQARNQARLEAEADSSDHHAGLDVLAKLQAAQDRIAGDGDEGEEKAPEPELAPTIEGGEASPPAGEVDYGELATALLDRVGQVLGQDRRYLEQRLATMEEDLRRAREQVAEAREMAQRERQTKSGLEDENRALKSQNSALRDQVRARDENIGKLNQDHQEIARRAISEKSRRQLERTITEAPRVGVPA